MSHLLEAATVGPVDFAVLMFEGNKFNGDVAPALAQLQDDGVVRILDAAFVYKDALGSTAIVEIEDSEVADAFERVTGTQFDLLNDADLDEVAVGLPDDSSALIIVWENSWAARFATAVQASNGRLIAFERIPRENVLRAVAALDEE